jgi:hypothetical protein
MADCFNVRENQIIIVSVQAGKRVKPLECSTHPANKAGVRPVTEFFKQLD